MDPSIYRPFIVILRNCPYMWIVPFVPNRALVVDVEAVHV
jgi:hypothetical protein